MMVRYEPTGLEMFMLSGSPTSLDFRTGVFSWRLPPAEPGASSSESGADSEEGEREVDGDSDQQTLSSVDNDSQEEPDDLGDTLGLSLESPTIAPRTGDQGE
jgi:hypothetical protein